LGGLVMPFSTIDDESTSSGFTLRTGASVMDFGKNGFLPSLGLDGTLNTAWGIAASSFVELVFSTSFWLSPKAALAPPRARERIRSDPVFAGVSFISITLRIGGFNEHDDVHFEGQLFRVTRIYAGGRFQR